MHGLLKKVQIIKKNYWILVNMQWTYHYSVVVHINHSLNLYKDCDLIIETTVEITLFNITAQHKLSRNI